MSYTKQDSDYMKELHAMSKKLKANAEDVVRENNSTMKTEYYVTFLVRGNDEVEDEYLTIASGFSCLKSATRFAKQTVGTVEIVAQYIFANGEIDNEGENGEYVHIGFVDGVQQYHDEG